VTDCAYADIVPVLQREVPLRSGLPPFITPGVLVAARAIYGIDYSAARPLTNIDKLAPRPVFFIYAADDTNIPPSDMDRLAAGARSAGADVQTWLIAGAHHCNSYIVAGPAYVSRVVSFYTAALGPDMGQNTSQNTSQITGPHAASITPTQRRASTRIGER
jgi:hypothetical protein